MARPATPLVLFPNGSLARTADVPEGCIIVEEPDLPEYHPTVIVDQTEAVNGSKDDL